MRSISRLCSSLALIVWLPSADPLCAADPAITVSPGSDSGATIGDPCPTFSWGSVSGASSYDLAVYLLGEGESEHESKLVLSKTIPGAASSWTPSLGRCLEPGRRYAWSIRAVGGSVLSEWSPPSFFEVAALGAREIGFEELLWAVREALATDGMPAASVATGAGASPLKRPTEGAAAGNTEPRGTRGGGSDFSVDSSGNVEGASFLGTGAVLAYGSVRFDGVLGVGSYNVDSVSWNASLDRYEISLTDTYYSIDDVTVVSVSGNSSSCPGGASARQSSVSGDLLVYIVRGDGVEIQCSFRFVTLAGFSG